MPYLKTKLDELKKSGLELELELAHLEWLEDFVKNRDNDISSIPPGFVTSQFSGFSFYLNDLRSLETRRKELLLSVKETDPKVKMITNDIESGRRSFEESIKNEKERIGTRREALAEEVEESFREFSALPKLEAEYMRMKRIYEIKENVYVLLLAKKDEFGVAKAGFVSDLSLIHI